MTTVIAQKQGHFNRVDRGLSQKERLIAGLAPDPRAWEYRGEVIDLGKPVGYCVCGHEIRFEFLLHYMGETRIVGSVCIDNYADLDPAGAAKMREDLDKLQKEITAAKKKAELVRAQPEIDAAKQKYDAVLAEYDALVKAHYAKSVRNWIPYELYVTQKKIALKAPEYKAPKPYLKWYEKNTKKVEGIIARNPL